MNETKQDKIQTDLFGQPIVSDKDNVYVKKQTKEKKDLSDTISTEYVLEIVCKDAVEQEIFYNELIKRGFTCRILTL